MLQRCCLGPAGLDGSDAVEASANQVLRSGVEGRIWMPGEAASRCMCACWAVAVDCHPRLGGCGGLRVQLNL